MRASNYKSSLSLSSFVPFADIITHYCLDERHHRDMENFSSIFHSLIYWLDRALLRYFLSACVGIRVTFVKVFYRIVARLLTKCFRRHYDSALIKSCFTIWLIFLADVEFHIFARYYVYIGREARRNSFVRACRWIDSSIDSEFMDPNDRDLCAPTIRFSPATTIFIYHQRSDG